MSAPVTADDIVAGAVKYLATLSDVTAALGAHDTGAPWLFQHQLWVAVEGSGATAAVLTHTGGWAGANPHNTLRFPRLGLEIWADPMRDAGGNVTQPGEVRLRLSVVWQVIDAHLHRCYGGSEYWGALRVISSVRLADPVIYAVPDGGGLLRSLTYYAVTEG